METDNEEVQILSSLKHKGKTLRSDDLLAKSHSPFPTVSKDKGQAKEDTPMMEDKNAELKEVGLEVNLDPAGDKAQDGSHLDIDLYFKNGTDYFNKVFLWVQKEITSIKSKQIQEASKIETLEAIGTGKFSSLLDYLGELTIGNAEEIINAQHNSFQILENRVGATEKRIEGVENTTKRIGEKSHKIIKASFDSIKVLISKLESDQGEKVLGIPQILRGGG